jgi:hypothetical protein
MPIPSLPNNVLVRPCLLQEEREKGQGIGDRGIRENYLTSLFPVPCPLFPMTNDQ